MKKIFFFFFILFSFKTFSENLEDAQILNSIENMRWGLEWNIDTVKKALLSQNEKVRSSMVYTLSEIQNKGTEEYLISFLSSSIPWERFEGIKGFICAGLKEDELIKERLNDEQEFVILAAETYSGNDLEPVFKLLNSNNINLNLFGIELLTCKKEEGAKHLLNYLQDPRDEIRARAAEGLRFHKDPVYQKALFEALKKETYFYVQNSMSKAIIFNYNYTITEEGIFNQRISKIIYNSLKFFNKEKDFFNGLWRQINLLSEDKINGLSEVLSFFPTDEQNKKALEALDKKTISNQIKAEILEYLAVNSIKEGLKYFEKYLKDSDPTIRGNSIWGLASLKNKDYVNEIEKELKNENDYVRWCALWALEEILGSDSLKYAEEFLQDKSVEVRETAKDILNKYKKEGSMSNHIYWLGHDSILIQFNEKNIYFDPFQISKKSPPADYVFISHEHFDHLSMEDLKIISKPKTKIIIPNQWVSKLKELKCEIIGVKIGDKTKIDEFEVQVVPAYNPKKQFHPKNYGGAGYIVKIGQTVYYHAGDTDLIPEMKDFPEIDVAFLPVSGTYVMDSKEAAEATKIMKIKKAIPMHYGAIVGSEGDALEFQKLANCTVEILKKYNF